MEVKRLSNRKQKIIKSRVKDNRRKNGRIRTSQMTTFLGYFFRQNRGIQGYVTILNNQNNDNKKTMDNGLSA
ncbi:MAG: hypothetical protein K2O54_03405, partial [Prevotella sp.]|nr:hypothetical protein [Prevotella sp.]